MTKSSPRCKSTFNLDGGETIRCEHPAGHEGFHERFDWEWATSEDEYLEISKQLCEKGNPGGVEL